MMLFHCKSIFIVFTTLWFFFSRTASGCREIWKRKYNSLSFPTALLDCWESRNSLSFLREFLDNSGKFWLHLKNKNRGVANICATSTFWVILGNSGYILKNKNYLRVANICTNKSLVPRALAQNISSCSSALDFLGFSLNSGVQGELFSEVKFEFLKFILWLAPQIYFWLLHLFFPNTVKKS